MADRNFRSDQAFLMSSTIGRAADNRAVASGTYLTCYFLGRLADGAVLGQLFDRRDGVRVERSFGE
jgi:hypothetical protein